MCGILALWGKETSLDAAVALNKIKHRGLDATKVLHFENIALGFNRLAINDKSLAGMQPFEYGDFVGVFNGEIYNAVALRKEFKLEVASGSDTAIILPLFEKIGTEIIHFLDGFYAGIIYNKLTGEIFTLRDYIGKKPFLFGRTKSFSFLTNELKAIKNITNFEIVPKGFCVVVDTEIKLLERHKILDVAKQDLKEAITTAVRKRVPKKEKQFGVFLSGGLDSSIVSLVTSSISEKVIYYSLASRNSSDKDYVFALVDFLKIRDKLKIISVPSMDEIARLIPKIVYYTESYNPSVISNGLATFLLSKAAHDDGLKVVLTGEGADELFCGYPLSKEKQEWIEKRKELIEHLDYTELRRLDLAAMANTIEVRCPFLDRAVFSIANQCTSEDLIDESNGYMQGKKILRELFREDLPDSIIRRKKVSFDVGAGVREHVVVNFKGHGKKERACLKEIWLNFFPRSLSESSYFHVYPTFDRAIDKRGKRHR